MTAQNSSRSIGPQVVFGLAVVVFGLLLTANNLGIGHFNLAIRFWPMVFTALGIAILLEKGSSSSRKFFGAAMLIGGLWQTGVEAFGLHIYIDDYWPLVIVALGVFLVVRSMGPRTPPEDYTTMGGPSPASTGGVPPFRPSDSGGSTTAAAGFAANTDRDESINAFAFMGGVRRNIVSAGFRRANVTAVMGGVVLDFRQCAASGGESVVETFAFWGGIEVKVPPDWQVVNEVSPIMGGVDDRSLHTQPIRHRLVLKGVVFMAGVEVK